MNKISDRIYELVTKELHDKLAPDEKEELAQWIAEKEDHKKIYEELKNINTKAKALRQDFNPDINKALKKVKGQEKKINSHRLSWYKYVALFSIPLGIALGLLLLKDNRNIHDGNRQFSEIARPGSEKAILKLTGGQVIRLDMIRYDSLLQINTQVRIMTDSSRVLCYTGQDSATASGKTSWNELDVPRGGEYRVILSDGTKVWMNAASKLTFPEYFSGTERRVKLSGEAFFEVVHNVRMPFIVETEKMDVKVLGTRFNVMAYKEDSEVQTTLVQGSVEIISKGISAFKLQPGEQAYSEGDKIEKRKVNLRQYTSWVDGKFVFSNATLEDIFKQVSRWYDVHIFFSNEKLKKTRFSGALIRFNPLEELIQMIESTSNVRFSVKNKTIIISE